jgi:flagellar biosynthetic protein FlhB
VVKIVIIGAVAFFIIRSNITKLANMQTVNLWQSVVFISNLAMQLLIICALLMLALAIPDYFFQKYQFTESLKMTKEELKEEYKENEGDPQMRARLRQRMNELLSSDLRSAIQQSTVIIRNPTHYAIALKYDAAWKKPVPLVTAKGEDEMAFKIFDLAKEFNIPTVVNRPLARTMYPLVKVGQEVPEEFWAAIAVILTRVLKLNGERRA